MASVVDICNRALQKLGAKRITSLEQDSRNARSCNVAYPSVRDSELRAHPWNCAIKRATLAADATAPDWGRAASFQLPSDFLRKAPPYPEDNYPDIDYQIEGRKILTDETDVLYLRYVAQIIDPNEMDPLLREAISARLAVELSEELSQSSSKKEALKGEYVAIIREARKTNAIENIAQESFEGDWVTSRV